MSIATESASCGHISDLEAVFNAIFVKVVKSNTTVWALRGKYIVGNNTTGVDDAQACSDDKSLEQRIVQSIGLDQGSNPALNIIQITDSGATVTEGSCSFGNRSVEEILKMVFNYDAATGQYGITVLQDV